MGIVPENIQHVIVAGVPDLNRIAETYLRTLESAGVSVTVLIDAPHCERGTVRRLGKTGPESVVAEVSSATSRRLCGCCRPGIRGANCCPLRSGRLPWAFVLPILSLFPFTSARCTSRVWSPTILRANRWRLSNVRPWQDFGLPLLPMVESVNFELSRSIPFSCACSAASRTSLPTAVLAALDELQTKILVETVDDAVRVYREGGSSASSTRGLIVAVGEAQTNIRRLRITRRFA